MRVGESEILYGVTNSAGNVFIDSFQRTQKFAEDTFAAVTGKPWAQCVAEDGSSCRPFRVTIEPVQLMTANATPFKFRLESGDLAPSFVVGSSGRGMTLVYPTATFAESAGFPSWGKAVEAMRAGKIIHGRGPKTGGKTMLDVQLFNQAVADAGMRAKYVDWGIFAVGLPERF